MKRNLFWVLATCMILLAFTGCSGGGDGAASSSPTVSVPTTTVSGAVSLPAGESASNYTVVSLGATSTLSDQGAFTTQVYKDGVAVVAAMPTGKDFGYMNVICSSSSSSVGKTAAAEVSAAGMQKSTASPASSIALNAKTTAVSLVFISPYLLTNDPPTAKQLISIIESDPQVNNLASLIDSLYSKRDPLGEQSLQQAIATAIQSVVNTLSTQQSTLAKPVAASIANPTPKVIHLPKSSAKSIEAAVLGTENTYYSYTDYITVNTDQNSNNFELSVQSKDIGSVDWVAEVMKLDSSQFTNYSDFKLKSSVNTTIYNSERSNVLGTLDAPAKSLFRYIDLIDLATDKMSTILYGENIKYVSVPVSSDAIYLVRSYSGAWGDKNLKSFVRSNVPHGSYMDTQAVVTNITLGALDALSLFVDIKAIDLDIALHAGITAASDRVNNILQGDKPQLKDLVSVSEDVLMAMFKETASAVLDKSLENMLTKTFEVIGKSLIDAPGKISGGGKIVDRVGQMLTSATAMETALVVVGNPFTLQVQTPTIGQNTSSGAPGSKFVQWGMGFSPNTNATLHFKVAGVESATVQEPVRSDGTFSIDYIVPPGKAAGTYTWWGVDASSKVSNTVTYTIGSGSNACTGGNGNYCGDISQGQDVGYLYSCINGVYSLKSMCSNGCQQNVSGVNDTCKSLTAGCPGGNGLYCGDPSKGQNSNYLYQCASGSYTLQNSCTAGCQNNALGVNDSCKASTAVCPSGNGLYCGNTSVPGQSTSNLYQCTNGSYTLSQQCSSGCQVNSSGTNDSCKVSTATCPSGNGLYCGSSSIPGQTISNLYQCTNGSYTLSQQCSSGCQSNGSGVNDSCKAPAPTCPSGNGLYCGSSSISGQNTSNLYQCTNGSYTLSQQCSSGCQSNGSGVNDSCKTPVPTCPSGNGLYCGSSSISGQSTSNLYQCTNGSYSVSQQCSSGCQSNGSGVNDSCKAPAPTCPSGNGLYCGSSSISGQSTSNLYQCTNGSYSLSQQCSNGCQSNGSGVNDSCKAPAPTCPSGNGLYCGGSVGLNSSYLYSCSNGVYSKSKTCDYGCQVNSSGTDDACKPAPSSSCPSGNGLYCGSSVGLTSNVLYNCSNGTYTKSKTCTNGCKVAASGTNDYCK